MSEENKTTELKNEDLEKVNGGFGGGVEFYNSLKNGDRVRVREKRDGYSYVYCTGYVAGLHSEFLDPYGMNIEYFVMVQIDNYAGTKQYRINDVERE